MPRMNTIDKERRYEKIRKLIKKYHTKDVLMRDVKARVREEMGISTMTIVNAMRGGYVRKQAN